MTVFALLCALMLVAALALLARPLLKSVPDESRSRRISVFVLTGTGMAVLASALYLGASNWPWQAGTPQQVEAATAALIELQRKTETQPGNVDAWLELGHAHVASGSYPSAAAAYERAYELTQGQNIDAVTGLAEALVLTDPGAINTRAVLLVEAALKLQPENPKALWYGGLMSLQADNLAVARDRFKLLLAQNPPPQVRAILERQILDLTQQLDEPVAAAPASSPRKIVVRVSLPAARQTQLQHPLALFVLARNPQQPGPPLAVERHQSSDLPLQVELTVDDAMLPTRTLADAQEVEIVARLSAGGAPTEQPGDLFGTATWSFLRQGEQGSVAIEINQRVP